LWESLPKGLIQRFEQPPENPMDALSLARDLTDSLSGEQQLWLISWWQVHLWNRNTNPKPLRRLEKLRLHLLRFVQPRLAWEVALLEIVHLD